MSTGKKTTGKRIKVLACAVFERELEAVKKNSSERLDVQFIDAGLHSRPRELRARLQEAIDGTEGQGYERIVIVYGLCGRGLIGLIARDTPLVIARVHDCVALFLGSPEEYKRQHAACPGTFYITPGWFEKKAHPESYRIHSLQKGWRAEDDPHFDHYRDIFGEENARFIVEFFQSWRKNYRRVVLINNSLGNVSRYRNYAKALAEVSGWVFEELPGSLTLIESLIAADATQSNIAIIPPHHMVIATNDSRLFSSVPADPSEEDVLRADRVLSGVQVGRFVLETPSRTMSARGQECSLALGIDAGGTFTDAVLVNLETKEVMSKAKAPTTPQDYSIGIEGALRKLDSRLFAKVCLVSLSTTLATNAIVEGRGGHVGLILMPIDDWALDQIQVRPVRIVPGKMSIGGEELEPVCPDAVRRAVEEMIDEGVEALAVSGYGSVHNPTHEKQVKSIVQEITDVPVVCGHELSGKLNFVNRAHTAVLNARLMPIIDELFQSVEQILRRCELHAPVFVVRGDGSLMELSAARMRPIETVLSGPAASAVGAQFLTGEKELMVIDIGGTTTDVAVVSDGKLFVCDEGALVGDWQTSVEAADVLTTGLGGDSYVKLKEGGMSIVLGPERVIPLSVLAVEYPVVAEELAELAERSRFERVGPAEIEYFQLVRYSPSQRFSQTEREILKVLRERPYRRQDLAQRIGVIAPELVPLERLERLGVLRRCAFTPTDALHVLGIFVAFDRRTPLHAASVLGRVADCGAQAFADRVRQALVRRLAYQVIRRELANELGDPDRVDNRFVHSLLGRILDDRSQADKTFSLAFTEHRRVVGIGAPAKAFLPQAGAMVGTDVTIPKDAEVANAIGAVAARVIVRERVVVRPDETGAFIMMGPFGRREFRHLDEAQKDASRRLAQYLRQKAEEFGTDEQAVTIDVQERTGRLADGGQQFLELVVQGTLEGAPRVAV